MEDSYRRGHLRRDVCPASKQKSVILNAHRGGPARPAGGHEGSQRKQSVIQSSTCEASEAEILRGHLVGSAQNDSALVWRRRAKVTWRWHFFVASLPPRCHSEEPSFQATRNLLLMVPEAKSRSLPVHACPAGRRQAGLVG